MTARNPKWECFRDKAGKWRFRLKARNGRTVLQSEAYGGLAKAQKGICAIIDNAAAAELVILK